MNSVKPHYTFREGKMVMTKEITPVAKALPAHIHPQEKSEDFGYIPPGQMLLPRIKLMQATSPECAEFPGKAIPGEFWHTTMMESLGSELIGVPIKVRTSYVLWAPKGVPGEDRGVLARATQPPDFPWDPPNTQFKVRFPMNPKTYVWDTKRNVKESGLSSFGSSRQDDPNSHPAATLTFEILWYLPQQDQLVLSLTSRAGIKPTNQLFTWIKAKQSKMATYYQLYKIIGTRLPGPGGESFFGYKFSGAGYVEDPVLAAVTKAIFDQWKDIAFANVIDDEEPDGGRHSSPPRESPVEPHGEAGVIDNDDPIPF
jgi:hypothetical protein